MSVPTELSLLVLLRRVTELSIVAGYAEVSGFRDFCAICVAAPII